MIYAKNIHYNNVNKHKKHQHTYPRGCTHQLNFVTLRQ